MHRQEAEDDGMGTANMIRNAMKRAIQIKLKYHSDRGEA